MQQEYWDELKHSFYEFQKPFQDMMELNVRTFQKLAYIKPDDLPKLQTPEALIDQSVNILIENCHQSLNYTQKAFQLLEKHLLKMLSDIKSTKH